jgi:hypothetical protein
MLRALGLAMFLALGATAMVPAASAASGMFFCTYQAPATSCALAPCAPGHTVAEGAYHEATTGFGVSWLMCS